MKISQEDWRTFFKLEIGVLILFVFAMISSTLYAIYLLKNNQLPNQYLSEYLEVTADTWSMHHWLFVFMTYFKRCALVWLMGLFTFMVPFGLALVFIYIFSYGFSITWVVVNFGIYGVGKSIVSFGIQGILMAAFLLCLSSAMIEKNKVFNEEIRMSYPMYLILGAMVCLVVSIAECLIGIK